MSHYNKLRDVIVGLEIFKANGGSDCAAEHDVLFAAQKDGKSLTRAEVEQLQKHGWFPNSEICGGCADDDDPEESTFFDPDDEDKTRHLLDCTAWAVFV